MAARGATGIAPMPHFSGRIMADLPSDTPSFGLKQQQVSLTAHARRARYMIVVATGCAFGLVALATTVLSALVKS